MDQDGTPLTIGRGKRIATQPARLNYPSLGNPNLGGNMPIPSTSGTQPQTRPPRAPSVTSSVSSTATKIRLNELDIKKKIAELEEENRKQQEHFNDLKCNLAKAEQHLELLMSEESTPDTKNQMTKLKHDIVDIKIEIKRTEDKMASLYHSFVKRKQIIEEEGEIQNDIIRGDGVADLGDLGSDDNEEVDPDTENVTGWLQQQPYPNPFADPASGQPSSPSNVNRVNQKNENVSMTDLISALQNLVPAQQEPIYNNKDLPFFDGKPEDWLIFKSEYERTERKHQPSQNIIRLRQHLKGSAAAAVGHLLDNPNNIPTILETLKELFGNPKHIIKYLIEKVKAAKPPDVNKPASVVEFVTAVDSLVTNILSYGLKEYVNNMQLLDELVDKLPTTLKWDWVKFKRDSNENECLKTFQTWMKGVRSLACEFYTPSFTESKKSPEPRRRRLQGVHAAKEAPICNYCDMKYHRIDVCRRFAELTHEEKIEAIKEKELCFKCLEKGHHAPRCDKVCSVDSCQGPHHKLIHLPRKDGKKGFKKSINQKSPSPSPTPPEVPSANLAVASGGDMCLIPVQVTGPKGNETVLALLDTGSSLTMLEEDVAKKIGLKGAVKPLSFNVFGKDVRANPKSMIVSVSVKGVQRGSSTFKIDNARTVDSLGIPASPLNIKKMKEKHPYLECVRAKSIGNQKPKMIIGADNHRLFRSSHAIEDPEEKGPSGNLCKLGWYISDVTGGSSCYFACQSCNKEDDADLHQSMKEFFAIEEKGMKAQINPARSKEDQRAFKLLEENTKQVGDRWETCLLWKEDNLELPSSKHMALNRLKLMEKKMDRDSDFAKLSCDKFSDYIEKGFLVPVEKSVSGIDSSKRKWYLPWFFAYHPTKKPRLVFDAAAKAGGKSLNDYLLKGPDLINSLPDVLMRFRSHPIAVTGDIKEMFHQVRLRAEDWPSQTILYRGMDRSQPPKEYYMTVLFFGAASSPCSAIYTKNRNAELFTKKYPEAVSAIKRNDYVDDFLCGAKSASEAITLQQQVREIHAHGGFQIVKWNSNSKEVLEAIPESMRAERNQIIAMKSDVILEKTLGMWWNPEEDCFQFKLNLNKIPSEVKSGDRNPTKREVTSFIMSLFDPIGFISPVKVRALIIIQNIWRSGIGWDDEVSHLVNEQWNDWLQELHHVAEVKVPRKFTAHSKLKEVDMHVLVDASEEAYSAVIYFVFGAGEDAEMTFVAGKARVAPLKGLTIPRMELQAALMGARLATSVTACFKDVYKIQKKTFWSDSKTVLCWLRSESGRFKVFIQTRVGEILELTDPNMWRWVPTKLNVADDATRARRNEDFSSTCRWLLGEKFLLLDESEWPKEKSTASDVNQEDLEVRNAAFAVSSLPQQYPVPEISRFSSWLKLIRSTAALFLVSRFIKNKEAPKNILVEDMSKAEKLWIKQSQLDSFPEELKILKISKDGETKDLPKNSRLAFLSPTLNDDGIIILGGRINAAPGVSEILKRPPILDPAHPYTKLLLKWLHEENQHQGQEAVMNLARKKAWIIDCRRAVRSTWANCQVCKLKKLQPIFPEMGQLPTSRLGESHTPFFHTGVDYFGPLQVKVNRSTVKRWGVIFTCMSTRAVHFELADGLDTGEFLNVFSRFISVRGPPSHMWSDNGTNFVGANKELKAAVKEWNSDEVCRVLSVKGTQWHFTPPASPHMGGSYERLIGMAKKILSSMLTSQAPRESVLRTLLFEAMNIMNGRPLTYASTDPEDSECLTPNHLLRMSCMEVPTLPGLYEEKDKFRTSWKYCQHLANEFWRRWTDECLPTMAQRATWRSKCEPIQQGDVVILKDNLVPRSAWRKGIIVKVYPGKDGQVRIVDVRVAIMKSGESKTPVIKIYRRSVVKVIPIGERIVLGQHWEGGNVPVQSE